MKSLGLRIVAAGLMGCGLVLSAAAQDAPKPAYLDTNLPPEKRAADLVNRMTLEEKATPAGESGACDSAAEHSARMTGGASRCTAWR